MADEEFYRIDSTGLSFAEYWRMSPVIGFPFVVLLKLIRVRLPMKFAIARMTNLIMLSPYEIRPGKMTRYVEVAVGLKLQLNFVFTIPTLGDNEGSTAVFLSDDGLVITQVVFASSRVNNGITVVTNENVIFSCATLLENGKVLATSDSKKMMDSLSFVEGETLYPRGPEPVYPRHRERMKSCASSFRKVTPDELEHVIVELNNRDLDERINRGVFVLMSEDEVEAMRL